MTISLCIDSVLLGTEKNLVIDDGYHWTSNIPMNSWHLSGKIKLYSDRCLDTLLRLNGIDLDINPPKKYVAAMMHFMSGSNVPIPWSQVMPDKAYRAFVKNLINQVTELSASFIENYYVNTWVPQSIVLRSLQRSKVTKTRFNEVLTESGMNSRVIESFRPDDSGYASPVAYDRFGTRTGRLTIQSGPSILTLKKEYRDMLCSSFEGGKIAYIDFAALEARVLLYEAGGECNDVDMYSYISRELFGGNASRKAIKGAVISELYGSSKAALGVVLGIKGKELDDFVSKVKDFFKTSDLRKRLKDQFLKHGYITNRYGRRVPIEEPLDHIFINSYAQSTGVDVSLLGFSKVVDSLSGCSGIRPLFVLHDALILDVSPECLAQLEKIKDVEVPGYQQKFPLKVELM